MIRLTTTTALLTLMAAPVMADVTAPDVWNGFTAFYQSMGLKIDATQTQEGNTTTIRDLKISGDFPFDMGSISVTTNGLDLVENGDGTVAIKVPDHMPLAAALALPNDLFVTANVGYQFTNYAAVASGDPDDITVTYAIEKMVMRLGDIALPDAMASEIEMTMAMENFAGTTTYKIGDMLLVSQHAKGGEMAVDGSFAMEDPIQGAMKSTFSMLVEGMKTDSNLALPVSGIDLLNLSAHLRDGMSLQVTSKVGSSATRNRVTSMGETVMDQKTFAQGTDTSLSLASDGLKIDSAYTNYAIDYILQELPFPIRLNFAKAGGSAELPLLKSDAEQDVSYALTFESITMGDELWAMFDPTGELPRDPATLTMDLSGKGRLFMDLLDFEAIQNAFDDGNVFAEPTSITINALDFTAIGAKMAASGMFTFDNDDLETFNGIPAPTGTATMHFAGVNAVIDSLIDIGLLDSGDALGARMGLGMFTVIGERKDTLVSEIEITPDGHISANGKRLK